MKAGEIATIKQPIVSSGVALSRATNSAVCDRIRTSMAVLHISYNQNPQTSKAAHDGFYKSNDSLPTPKVVSIELDDQHRGVAASCVAETQTAHRRECLLPYDAP